MRQIGKDVQEQEQSENGLTVQKYWDVTGLSWLEPELTRAERAKASEKVWRPNSKEWETRYTANTNYIPPAAAAAPKATAAAAIKPAPLPDTNMDKIQKWYLVKGGFGSMKNPRFILKFCSDIAKQIEPPFFKKKLEGNPGLTLEEYCELNETLLLKKLDKELEKFDRIKGEVAAQLHVDEPEEEEASDSSGFAAGGGSAMTPQQFKGLAAQAVNEGRHGSLSFRRLAEEHLEFAVFAFGWIVLLLLCVAVYLYERHVEERKRTAMQSGRVAPPSYAEQLSDYFFELV